MKRILLNTLSALVLFTIGCQREAGKDKTTIAPDSNPNQVLVMNDNLIKPNDASALTKEQLDAKIEALIKGKKDFNWAWMDDHFFWSAVNSVKPIVAIGYKPTGVGDISNTIHEINIQDKNWKSTHDALIQFILTEYNILHANKPLTIRDIMVEDDTVLPRIVVRMGDYDVLAKLRHLQNVRYMDVMDYGLTDAERSASGCSGTAATTIPAADMTTITPNARVPWNFTTMGIPTAWNMAGATNGAGITVGVIDAGLSNTQPMLNGSFASGLSTGRTVTSAATLGTTPFNTCTHGTSMAGLAVGPRNNSGATMGVAWKSSLHFIRAAEDVILDGSDEQTGVKNAFIAMGNNEAVKIISISLGTPIYSGTLEDGVNYAYGKGKMIFAAAGTSTTWLSWWGVIYPAKLDKCVAMTGIRENGSTCGTCHDGAEVDFTVTMERDADNSRNSLSYHTSGTQPGYVGGSSCSTAMGAGMAALIYTAKPGLTREKVLQAMSTTAQYTTKNGYYGWGKINPVAAITKAKTL
jgi:serine protease